MSFGMIIRDTLSSAKSIYNSSDVSDSIVEEDITKLLFKTFEEAKRIGWLSIEGREDLFVARGGAWVCANFLWSYDDVGKKNNLISTCITVFSHRMGAGMQNIIVMGLINFKNGDLWMVYQQVDGSYKINRNDILFDKIPASKIASSHSSERAAKFARTFGITLSI